MRELGRRVQSPGRIFITGGGTAILVGWREMTIDIDLKADPEPVGFFEAIAVLKDELDVNVELAAPDDFIPVLPGWQERSLFVTRHGEVDFFHMDPYSQALSKLERGHARDLSDVAAMASRHLIEPAKLRQLFVEIEPALMRYPAIDPGAFRRAVESFCARQSA